MSTTFGRRSTFYQRAFGLTPRFTDDALGYADFETGLTTLAIEAHSLGVLLTRCAYQRHSPAGVEIAFLTTDAPGSHAKVLTAGGTPVVPKTHAVGVGNALFTRARRHTDRPFRTTTYS